MSGLSLSRSSLPIDGLSGVFTKSRVRRGQFALVTEPSHVISHNLLAGAMNGSFVVGRNDPLLNQKLGDVDGEAACFAEAQRKNLAHLVQSQPRKRPMVAFSRERFLALRHTWTTDRHFTMFLPHIPCVDIVLPTKSLLISDSNSERNVSITTNSNQRRAFDRSGTAALDLSTKQQASSSPTVLSDILFEVNDPFPCQFPDPEDVANPAYWRHIKQWLNDYGRMVASNNSGIGRRIAGGKASLLTPNVELVKIEDNARLKFNNEDDDMMPSLGRSARAPSVRYGLKALRDIPPDSELFLSYGADWWRQRLMSTLLLSAETPSEMGSIRWIERMCAADGQEDESFPCVVVEKVLVRGRDGGSAVRPVLWDSTRQERASAQSVVAFAVRQSCIDGHFAAEVMSLFAGADGITVIPSLRRLVRRYLTSSTNA